LMRETGETNPREKKRTTFNIPPKGGRELHPGFGGKPPRRCSTERERALLSTSRQRNGACILHYRLLILDRGEESISKVH